MNAGATAERVYDALKHRLLGGDLLPGEKLEPARFADELASSVTPIRDALHRLAGERLVETRVSDGFHLPLVTEPGLRDLYRWNAWLARAIMSSWPRGAAPTGASALAVEVPRATADFFEELGSRAANGELLQQILSASDRLASARVAEKAVMTDLETELRALAVLLDTGRQVELSRALATYHRRRDRMVPTIVRAIYHR